MGKTTAAVSLALVILLLIVVVAAIRRRRKKSEGFAGRLLGRLTNPALRDVQDAIGQIEKFAAFTDLDSEFADDGPYGQAAALKVRQANLSAKVVLASTRRLGRVLRDSPSPAKLRGLAAGLRGTSELFRAAGAGLAGAGRDLRRMAAAGAEAKGGSDVACADLDRAGQKFEDIGAGVYRLDDNLRRLCGAVSA